EASGYLCVCLTVDVQVYSRRERDITARFSPREAMSKAPNPRPPDSEYPARLTWADVEWLRKTTRLPIGLKGIMTTRDARRAVDAGVELIWVSNHGGRQLDATQASIDALPAVADTVAGAASIIVDGGFARGTDVIKGLAWGASAVAVGRTALWGLAADGAAGVACTMDILRREIRTSMALAGQTSVRSLTRDVGCPVDGASGRQRVELHEARRLELAGAAAELVGVPRAAAAETDLYHVLLRAGGAERHRPAPREDQEQEQARDASHLLHRRVRGGLQDVRGELADQRPVLLGLRELGQAILVGEEPAPLLLAVREAVPGQDVEQLVGRAAQLVGPE